MLREMHEWARMHTSWNVESMKEFRFWLGLSREKFAKRVGLHWRSIGIYENEKGRPSARSCYKYTELARLVGYDVTPVAPVAPVAPVTLLPMIPVGPAFNLRRMRIGVTEMEGRTWFDYFEFMKWQRGIPVRNPPKINRESFSRKDTPQFDIRGNPGKLFLFATGLLLRSWKTKAHGFLTWYICKVKELLSYHGGYK